MSRTEQAVRKIATGFPDVESGVACKGTSLESATFTVKKKAFVFLRTVGDTCELRLKAAGTWVKKVVPVDEPPAELKAWLQESYAALAPKRSKSGKK